MKAPSDVFQTCSAAVVEAIRAGASIEDAARAAGCAPRTVDRWLQSGRLNPNGPYGKFSAQVDATRREQGLPGTSESEVMSEAELHRAVSRAVRNGSVAAMRLAHEMKMGAEDRAPDAIDAIVKKREERLAKQRRS